MASMVKQTSDIRRDPNYVRKHLKTKERIKYKVIYFWWNQPPAVLFKDYFIGFILAALTASCWFIGTMSSVRMMAEERKHVLFSRICFQESFQVSWGAVTSLSLLYLFPSDFFFSLSVPCTVVQIRGNVCVSLSTFIYCLKLLDVIGQIGVWKSARKQ